MNEVADTTENQKDESRKQNPEKPLKESAELGETPKKIPVEVVFDEDLSTALDPKIREQQAKAITEHAQEYRDEFKDLIPLNPDEKITIQVIDNKKSPMDYGGYYHSWGPRQALIDLAYYPDSTPNNRSKTGVVIKVLNQSPTIGPSNEAVEAEMMHHLDHVYATDHNLPERNDSARELVDIWRLIAEDDPSRIELSSSDRTKGFIDLGLIPHELESNPNPRLYKDASFAWGGDDMGHIKANIIAKTATYLERTLNIPHKVFKKSFLDFAFRYRPPSEAAYHIARSALTKKRDEMTKQLVENMGLKGKTIMVFPDMPIFFADSYLTNSLKKHIDSSNDEDISQALNTIINASPDDSQDTIQIPDAPRVPEESERTRACLDLFEKFKDHDSMEKLVLDISELEARIAMDPMFVNDDILVPTTKNGHETFTTIYDMEKQMYVWCKKLQIEQPDWHMPITHSKERFVQARFEPQQVSKAEYVQDIEAWESHQKELFNQLDNHAQTDSERELLANYRKLTISLAENRRAILDLQDKVKDQLLQQMPIQGKTGNIYPTEFARLCDPEELAIELGLDKIKRIPS